MSRTAVAFLVAPLLASLFYWWVSLVEYYLRVGVWPYGPFTQLLLILLFAYGGSAVVCVPIYFLLRAIGAAKPVPLLLAGTLVGWLFISLLDTGKPWLQPEAFATGLLAAGSFVFVRRQAP